MCRLALKRFAKKCCKRFWREVPEKREQSVAESDDCWVMSVAGGVGHADKIYSTNWTN